MANVSPGDAELEHLLTQLLRMVSPPFSADDGGARTEVDGSRESPDGGASNEAYDSAGDDADGQLTAVVPAADAMTPGVPAARVMTAASGPVLPALSSSEARALIELVAARGIAQGELAGLLGLDKSTVSRLAAGLERKGWVRRGRDEGNQRYVRLYLTPQGGEVAARVWQAWQSRQARILAALSADERAGLAAGLGGLVRGLAAEGLLGEPAGNGH
jgi:DNA-binding MarR family transcriptional regulator